MIKELKYVKINSVNPLYLIIGKTNEYFENINGIRYLTLVPTDKRKEVMKKCEELCGKIRSLIKSKTNTIWKLSLIWMMVSFKEKTLELRNVIIEIVVVRVVFHEGNKYYPQVS